MSLTPPVDGWFPTNPVQPPIPIVYERQELIWEYKQVIRNLAKEEAPTAEELNVLGAEGWELAGVFNDSLHAYFYFKRLGREERGRRGRSFRLPKDR